MDKISNKYNRFVIKNSSSNLDEYSNCMLDKNMRDLLIRLVDISLYSLGILFTAIYFIIFIPIFIIMCYIQKQLTDNTRICDNFINFISKKAHSTLLDILFLCILFVSMTIVCCIISPIYNFVLVVFNHLTCFKFKK